MTEPQQAMITLDMAGDVVTELVDKNAERILTTRTLGKNRQQSSRNILNETMLTRYQLVSLLAVAIDRLAVYQALTPTPSVQKASLALRAELRNMGCASRFDDKQLEQLARAVLDR